MFQARQPLDPRYRGNLYDSNSFWITLLNFTGVYHYMPRGPYRRTKKDRLENDAFPSLYVAETGLWDPATGQPLYGIYVNEFVPKNR
jgi:hypothetical protein